MNKEDAYSYAESMLHKLIENQPNLLVDSHGNARSFGADIADFCHDFMDQYAKRLQERKGQE